MVKRLTLGDLIEGLTGWHLPDLEMPVSPVIDSRHAESGSVFFAFEGENVDGHDYVGDAFDRGALAAVVEHDVAVAANRIDVADRETANAPLTAPLLVRVPNVLEALQDAARWWRERLDVRVIGVTGSVGKTTTKEVTARVLDRRYRVLRNPGSFNNEIGLPLTVLGADGACERMVLEMGMYVPGDIRFLAGIARPHVGVVTNVEPVHAERAGGLETIARGKRELVEVLPHAPEGVAILNYDDPRVRAMAEHTEARPFFYGLSPQADLWADEIQGLGLEGLRVQLHHQDTTREITVPLLGRHNAYTVLRAAAVALNEGLGWEEIIEGLRVPGPQLRLVTVEGVNDVLILDDTYNSSPPSAIAALDLLDDLDGRKVAVLGDMLELGDYEEAGHDEVGCRAADVVSELVAVGQLGKLIGEGARRCGLDPARIHFAPDGENATAILDGLLETGDVVLVKGSHDVGMDGIVNVLRKDGES
jgi:UDP-N-acetylmuramoyl-tripeptide--D-alanyl-D-alanine ligase